MSRGPGKWQKALLAALEEKGAVPVTWHFADIYERSLTPAEYSAIHRAADQLVKAGAAEWYQVWTRNHAGRRSLAMWIFLKGTNPKDYNLPEGKGALNLRHGEERPSGLSFDIRQRYQNQHLEEPSSTPQKQIGHEGLIPRYQKQGERIVCPRCALPVHQLNNPGGAAVLVCTPCLTALINEWAEANKYAIDRYISEAEAPA